jgi:hypothetical protein
MMVAATRVMAVTAMEATETAGTAMLAAMVAGH